MAKKFSLILLVQILGIVLCQKAPPQWNETYKVGGVLHLPYAEIEEPFQAWFDGRVNNSRIDFYDGTAKTYQLGEVGYGTSLKVVPFTTNEFLNQISCFQVNGTENDSVSPQSILPSLNDFTYAGEEHIDGKHAEKWTLTVVEGEKKNVYTMWLQIHHHGYPIPIKYDMMGYNTLLGSHYDHYYLTYHSYKNEPIPKEIFAIENKVLPCRSFPGPGNQHVHNFNPMAEFIRPETTRHVDSRFTDFIDTHGKEYQTTEEHTLRKGIFRQNVRFIESTNRQNKGFTLTVNHLADKTDKELKYLRGRLSSNGYNGGLPFPYTDIEEDDLPNQYDWRLYGAVTPVKDQAVCGSCWAFGTIGTLEGALFLKNGGHLVRLSEQALIDCSWGYGNNGCDGGEDFRSYQWIMEHRGVPTDADYGNYLGEDGFCKVGNVNLTAAITGWVNVTVNDENALRLAIFKHGPISVSIDASQRTFSFYSKGVYYDSNCGNRDVDLDHSVLAVGYGTMDGEDYWLVKNSWSTYWGNDGYILMSAKDNNCGVMTAPTYVTMD